ncbi:predicted protein [Uncinocarpus reesii 1704]|uniref:Uncharacterized protein n=1 Tax=Uncinocarpus reesii (strain UAMH 1704) TaxID=336963 RepID=C4JZ99_UNCRE|nr:uncharacterized protein UREG_07500 [Uncinocarpus reesii 1704]EEP82635.1 predicted protein [Uncinocarpus reesii 1704]
MCSVGPLLIRHLVKLMSVSVSRSSPRTRSDHEQTLHSFNHHPQAQRRWPTSIHRLGAMFATLPSPSPPHTLTSTTPLYLSRQPPQDANRFLSHALSMPQGQQTNQERVTKQPSSPPQSPSPFAQRYASQIRNPAARVAGRASRDIRRNAFFNRVKRNRESSMYNAREDNMLYIEYIAQKRRFEEEMARSAPEIRDVEDEMMDIEEHDRGKMGTNVGRNEQAGDGKLRNSFAVIPCALF